MRFIVFLFFAFFSCTSTDCRKKKDLISKEINFNDLTGVLKNIDSQEEFSDLITDIGYVDAACVLDLFFVWFCEPESECECSEELKEVEWSEECGFYGWIKNSKDYIKK